MTQDDKQPRGIIRPKAVAYYDRLMDSICEAEVKTINMGTLFLDTPWYLEERGGWSHPDTGKYWLEFVDFAHRKLGDRITEYTVFAEPTSMLGCQVEILGMDLGRAFPGIHNLFKASGEAMDIVGAGKAGVLLNLNGVAPWDEHNDKHLEAAKRHDGHVNRWPMDALFKGQYPDDIMLILDKLKAAPKILTMDMNKIARPCMGFLIVNSYDHRDVRDRRTDEEPYWFGIKIGRKGRDDEKTDAGWLIRPQGFQDDLMRAHEYYKGPIYAESGSAWATWRDLDGRIRDFKRIQYAQDYMWAALGARKAGVPVKGYDQWTAFARYEWGAGYREETDFLLFDFNRRSRWTPRDSAIFLKFLCCGEKAPVLGSREWEKAAKEIYQSFEGQFPQLPRVDLV